MALLYPVKENEEEKRLFAMTKLFKRMGLCLCLIRNKQRGAMDYVVMLYFPEMRAVPTKRILRAVSCFSRVSSSRPCMMGERQSCEER